MIALQDCAGCEDDFYNGRNPMGVKRCWSAANGQMVTRYRTGTWTLPTSKGAFCYWQKGSHYVDRLPDFVKAEDVVRARRGGR